MYPAFRLRLAITGTERLDVCLSLSAVNFPRSMVSISAATSRKRSPMEALAHSHPMHSILRGSPDW